MYDDGFLYFRSLAKKTLSFLPIKEFYNSPRPETDAILEKIARIPFHFIITLLPDDRIAEAFRRQLFAYRKSFYFKKNPAEPIPKPTAQMPVIYNILGNIEKQDSLVLTHDDLFDYLESVFQQRSMAETLKTEIREAKNFIMLGLPFDRWYMHLLLRLLSLHVNAQLVKYADGHGRNEIVTSWCQDEFQINFISSNISEFIDTLEQKCAGKKMLREPIQQEEGAKLNIIRQLIGQDELEKALTKLDEFLRLFGTETKEHQDDILHISGSLRRLKKKKRNGVLSENQINQERNRIRVDLLEVISEVSHLEK